MVCVRPRGGDPEQLVAGDTLLGPSEHLLSHAAPSEQSVATDGARRRQEETWKKRTISQVIVVEQCGHCGAYNNNNNLI